MSPKNKKSRFHRGIVEGYRSGLEVDTAQWLEARGIDGQYEKMVIIYTVPTKTHRYTPDFTLPNGIIIETKGKTL